MTPIYKMTFRDRLALDRTYLAKERTILAYTRTGLALIGVGLFVYKFITLEYYIHLIVTVAITLPGIIITVYGIVRTFSSRCERKGLECKLMEMGDEDGQQD